MPERLRRSVSDGVRQNPLGGHPPIVEASNASSKIIIMKNQNRKNKIKYLLMILISIVVVLIGIFIMSKKQDLDFDEVGTFGLANNTYQLNAEDYKTYTGEELLLNYAAVKDGEEFNISNVFFNQKLDTHPPLYYLLVNFVCSLRKDTFSMWYGLIINLLLMIVLFWEMRYFFNLVIDDKLMSIILSLIAFFTYGFINELVFIRMYVMLSVVSLAFAILIIEETKAVEANTIRPIVGASTCRARSLSFLLKFFIICIIGILTQYHFIVFAFYFSLVLAIHLINKKDYKLLFLTMLSGIIAIVTSIIIFPGIINHIFGDNSLHAINGAQTSSLLQRFYEILLTVRRAFFGEAIIIYLLILVILIIVGATHREPAYVGANTIRQTVGASTASPRSRELSERQTIISTISNNKWYFIILLCVIYYYVVICLTVKFTFARYLYNIYPLIIVSIIAPIYLLLKTIKPNLKYLTIALILVLVVGSRLKEEPFSLNLKTKQFQDFLNENKNIKILALYTTVDKNGRQNTIDTSLWKIQRPVYTFRNMEKIMFVDMSKNKDILYFKDEHIANDENLFLLIYSGEDDNEIIGGIMNSNGYTNVNKIIENTYYHMYLLSR